MDRTYEGRNFFSLVIRIIAQKMRVKSTNIFAALILALTVIAAASCEHKELCYYHPHTAPVRVTVDWSLFTMDSPTGMTAIAYPLTYEDQDSWKFVSHNINYITLDLEEGAFNTLVFNQDVSEFGTFEFSDLDQYDAASVKVVQTKSASWLSTKFPDTKVCSEPEWLAVGTAENVEVTKEMVQRAEEEFLANRKDQIMIRAAGQTINDVATVTPISVTKQIEFNVYCEGLYNLRSVRASIAGLAEGCILSSGENTEGKASHAIEQWDVNEFDYDITKGYLVSKLCTLGIPSGHNGTPEENVFSIHLLLVDNSTVIDYDFNVGDILSKFNELDGADGQIQKVVVDLRIPEKLPDVEPVGGKDGGFDIYVDNWGDEIITEIPI